MSAPRDAAAAGGGLRAPRWIAIGAGDGAALAALLLVAALSWLHLVREPSAPMTTPVWASAFLMWTVMMAAMMIPTATPVLATYAATQRSRAANGSGLAVIAFAAGYLLAWTAFSAAAATAQPLLGVASCHAAGLVDSDPRLAAVLLVAVGVYQWTPLKTACLRECQSPIGFLLTSWRSGVGGALRMGLRHGLVCVGCCWALMALMFVGGVMSLLWMAGLTLLVLAEKLALLDDRCSRALGVLLAVAGIGLWIVR